MAFADRISALAAEIEAALPVLDRINSFYDRSAYLQRLARDARESQLQ